MIFNINSRSNSTTLKSGTRGPSTILKLFLYKTNALSEASFNKLNEPVAPPVVARAQTTATVTWFLEPGNKLKGPAVCKNLLSPGVLPAIRSVQSALPAGSVLPGNIKLAVSVPPLPLPP